MHPHLSNLCRAKLRVGVRELVQKKGEAYLFLIKKRREKKKSGWPGGSIVFLSGLFTCPGIINHTRIFTICLCTALLRLCHLRVLNFLSHQFLADSSFSPEKSLPQNQLLLIIFWLNYLPSLARAVVPACKATPLL